MNSEQASEEEDVSKQVSNAEKRRASDGDVSSTSSSEEESSAPPNKRPKRSLGEISQAYDPRVDSLMAQIYGAGDNTYGQMGVDAQWTGRDGGCYSLSRGELMHASLVGSAPLVAVAAGHYHSAAVDAGGRLYTWGWGVHGQLGLGSIDDKWTR